MTAVGPNGNSKIVSTSSVTSAIPDVGGIGVYNCQNGDSESGYISYGTETNSANKTSVTYTVPNGQEYEDVLILAASSGVYSNGLLQISGTNGFCSTYFNGPGNSGESSENNVTGILCTDQASGSYTVSAYVPGPDDAVNTYPYISLGVYVFTSSTTTTSTTSVSTTSKTTTSTTSKTTTSTVSTARCTDSCVPHGNLCVCP